MFTRESAEDRRGARRVRLKIVGDGVTGTADTLRLQQGETVKDLEDLLTKTFLAYGVKLKWRWKVRNPRAAARAKKRGAEVPEEVQP